jgi:hypothetical protein
MQKKELKKLKKENVKRNKIELNKKSCKRLLIS